MDIRSFIEDYRGTWERATDVAALTRFFNIPYIAIGADSAVALQSTEADIERFNRVRLARFQEAKIVRWHVRGCDPFQLGAGSALVAVNWEAQRADGTVALAWRHYYNIVRTDAGLKIVLSTFSVGS